MLKKVLLSAVIVLFCTVSLCSADEPLQAGIDEGYKAFNSKDYKKATDEFIKVYKRLEDNGTKISVASYIGVSSRMLGDYAKSNRYFKEAYDYAIKNKDSKGASVLMGHIAENEKLAKNYTGAIRDYNIAVSFDGLKQDDSAALYYGLASSYYMNGDYYDAIISCENIADNISDNIIEVAALRCALIIGESYNKLNDIPEALKYLRNTYDRALVRSHYDIAIRALTEMGDIYIGLKRINTARAKYEDALAIMLEHNIIEDHFYSLVTMLSAPFFTKHNNASLGYKLDNYIKEHASDESYDNRSKLQILAGEYYILSNDYKRGLELFSKAYQDARVNNDNLIAIRALTGMAYLNHLSGRSAIANLRIDEAIFRSKSIKDFKGFDELLFIKAMILAKNFRMIESERLLLEAINTAEDETNLIRYKDELKRVQLVAKEDRLKYGEMLDNLTSIERDNESLEFSINELLFFNNPDIFTDEDAILNADNMTELPEDEEATREAIEDDNETTDEGFDTENSEQDNQVDDNKTANTATDNASQSVTGSDNKTEPKVDNATRGERVGTEVKLNR